MKLTSRVLGASAAVLALLAVTAGAFGRLNAGERPEEAAAARAPVLVELFTSEGCSSCPPADVYLRDLAKAGASQGVPVIVLGEHVDYWNRLGWRDPFSSSDFTARQSWYSGRLSSQVYTPQLVVDGQWETIGSDRAQATADIARAATSRKATVVVTLSVSGGMLSVQAVVETGALDRLPDADVYVALTESGLASSVTAGENAGRRLEHAAVTRRFEKAGQIKAGSPGARIETVLALDRSWDVTRSSVVVFVQERRKGAIVGAWGGSLPTGAI